MTTDYYDVTSPYVLVSNNKAWCVHTKGKGKAKSSVSKQTATDDEE